MSTDMADTSLWAECKHLIPEITCLICRPVPPAPPPPPKRRYYPRTRIDRPERPVRLPPDDLPKIAMILAHLKPDPAWASRALCTDNGNPDMWHQDGESAVANEAKRICRQCNSRYHCLDEAIRNHETKGIWGGLGMRARLLVASLIAHQEEDNAAGNSSRQSVNAGH